MASRAWTFNINNTSSRKRDLLRGVSPAPTFLYAVTGLYDVVCKVNFGNVKRLNCDEQQMNIGLNQII